MSYKKRVFLIGIDGATFDVMSPMMARGKLPNIARLMKDGCFGTMASCVPDLSPPAWTSMVTGVHPGKHGILDFFGHMPPNYDTVFFNAAFRTAEPVWNLLSRSGGKVCVINVPSTYPPDKVNGVMISGMDTPNPDSDFIHPPSLRSELREKMGGFELESMRRDLNEKHMPEFVGTIRRLAQNRLEVSEYLMDKEDWDFFMVVFASADRAQHEAWKYTEPDHPGYSVGDAEKYRLVIEDVYEQLDSVIGSIVGKLPEGTSLFVVSDHGFGPLLKGVRVENWLTSIDLLCKASRPPGFGLMEVKRIISGALPAGLKRVLRSVLRKVLKQSGAKPPPMMLAGLDMTRTRAYPLGGNGNIFINLKGRQPFGIVSPGEEYEKLRDDIIAGLESLRDPDTGDRMVERALKREEAYSVFPEHCADIIVRWMPGYASMDETRVGSMHGEMGNADVTGVHCWSGTHRPNGILVMNGADIKTGICFKDAQIVDIAPTILALLGKPVPRNMDGRLLKEALKDDFLRSHEVVFDDTPDYHAREDGEKHAYSEDESKAIGDKLRNLGYIG